MSAVAHELRRATHAKILELSLEQRLALTERLAEADVDLYCAAHGTSRDEARRAFVRQRQTGRRRIRVMQETA